VNEEATLFRDDAGVLLHPSSLPTDYGIGDFGPAAMEWLERLAEAGQSLWQVLPLGPTGYADSPYQALSAFAANPLFLSPDRLVEDGLLRRSDAEEARLPRGDRVPYAEAADNKARLARRALENFRELPGDVPMARAYARFRERESRWLEPFALYYALKTRFGGRAWAAWPAEFRDRHPEALERAREELAESVDEARVTQFLLDWQWQAVRDRATELGVRIVGDLPIFVAHDSADVWADRRLFRLREDGAPEVVAGVPPDYFSESGQLWGNPLYAWPEHERDRFIWWRRRMDRALGWMDVVRIDHFRGFVACWEVPGDAATAIDGRWVDSPGDALLRELSQDLGHPLPIIAEDLGKITEDVIALRDRFGLPGLRILQFAFGDDPMASTFAPPGYCRNCVAYSGTHDNDTVQGWFNAAPGTDDTRGPAAIARERAAAMEYFGTGGENIHWDFARVLYGSSAGAVLLPLQDVLGLGSESRMNVPGRPSGSWQWRLPSFDRLDGPWQALGALARETARGRARRGGADDIPAAGAQGERA